MNVLSLFAGIGGLDLGLERAGLAVVGQVEIEPFCRRVLAKHWPEVPRHDDVRTAVEWWRSETRPAVHVVAGGFPCQPVSEAGRKKAQADARWLWPDFADVVRDLRPAWVVLENVPGLLRRGMGMGDVLGSLAEIGYDAEWDCIPAAAVGALHRRDRVFVIGHGMAYANRAGCGPRRGLGSSWPPVVRAGWWAVEPDVGRVAYGIPGRVDRLRGLGNAVVPQVAEHIGRLVVSRTENPAGA